MNTIKMLMMAAFTILSVSLFAQTKTESFKVYGNCGMCKKRIEKAVKLEGISSAEWNTDTKMMKVTYDAAKITNDQIQKKIAAVGHDTEQFTADDKVYEQLPGCCLYDRKKESFSARSNHKH
jgi:periplasmic mercuric ion binding protein